jgi:mannonate dehydratase
MSTTAPSLRLTQRASLTPSPEELTFLRQLGYDTVYCVTPKVMTVEEIRAAMSRFSVAGITLHNIRYFTGGKAGYKTMADILLGTADRDQAIEDAKAWIRNCGQAGLQYTGSSLGIAGIWEDDPTETRGARVRDFDATAPNLHATGNSAVQGFNTPVYGRVYTRDEVLDNFKKYFVAEILPVAEQSGVSIGFHPDDVPVYDNIGGLPRIFGTLAKIDHIFELARNSPNIGLMMCCGTWIEGGNRMGATVTQAIRHFWQKRKFWEVHFRNVSGSIPHFHETFMDNGIYPMAQIMRTLVEIGYDRTVNLDHTPQMVGEPYAYPAYGMGYMQALLQIAQAERR